jgi:hypothetical protein
MKLQYCPVPVDSEIFGFPVARISALELSVDDRPDDDFRSFEVWRDQGAVRLVYCRLDHGPGVDVPRIARIRFVE